MQGVDTPETKHPNKPVQAYGKEASRFVTNLLKGEKVYLLPVGEKFHKGKYGRLIAFVYRAPDGLFVNAEIIRQGYGHAYTRYPGRFNEKFRQLERFAKNAKKGLWGTSAKTVTKSRITRKENNEQKSDAGNVFKTRTGKKYHRASCMYLRRSKISISLEDAKSSLEPCSRCSP